MGRVLKSTPDNVLFKLAHGHIRILYSPSRSILVLWDVSNIPEYTFFKTMQEKQRREELAIQHIQGLRGCPLHKAGISTSGPP